MEDPEVERQMAQNGAIVTPRSAFGITAALHSRNSICMDGKQILYPSGVFCAMYAVDTNEMSFLSGHDKVKCILGVALTNNKKYVALIEETEESEAQQVTVYSMQTLKKVRSLAASAAGLEAQQVLDMQFSENSKLLITQYGEPDHTLVVWRWYGGKVVATVRFETQVLKATFCPVDNNLFATVCASSASTHRLEAEEGSIRSVPVLLPSNATTKGALTSFAWLVGNLLAFTTSEGWIRVFQDSSEKGAIVTQEGDYLMVVVPRARGFVAAGSLGQLYFFDAADSQAKKLAPFMLTRTLSVRMPFGTLPSQVLLPGGGVGEFLARHAVMDLGVNNVDDSLAAVTAGGEVVTLNMVELQDREEKQVDQHVGHMDEHDHGPFKLLCGGFGRAKVLGMDAITFPPLLLTISADRMVRVYNYDNQHSIAITHLDDDPLCCSMHPSGNQILVGVHSSLRLYSIALDELNLRAEFSVRRCNLVRYSHGGSMFAAVGRSHTILVHHAYSMQQLGLLKGHVSAVTALSFSPNDRMLVSSGAGGAIYFWDMNTLTKVSELEYVDKLSIYCNAMFLSRHPGAVVRTNDGRIQHIREGKVEYEVAGPKGGDTAPACLLGDDSVLLSGTVKGTLQSYSWPSSFPVAADSEQRTPQEYRLHSPNAGVTCMVTLPQKGLVFTAGADGSVFVSQLALVLRGQLMELSSSSSTLQPQYVTIAEDRLIALKEKQLELLGVVAATKSASEYQTFRQTQALRDIITKLQDELSSTQAALEESKGEVAELLATAAGKERALVKDLEMSHMNAAEELERMFDKRLELESLKFKQLQAAKDDQQFRLEERMARMRDKHAEEVRLLEAEHARRVEAVEQQLQEAMTGTSHLEHFHNEYAVQAELDMDENRERMQQRFDDAGKVAETREAKLRADNNLLKRTVLRLKGDKAIEMKRMEKMVTDNNVLREGLAEQRMTITKLRQELDERDSVMADNYTTIQMLRRNIQDLEKHKYVLGYKASTYEARLQPTVQEAERLASELNAHDKELVSELKRINELTRTVAEKERLIKSMKVEIQDIKLAMKHQGDMLKTFSFDVTQVVNASDDRGSGPRGGKSARQKLLDDLYRKYCIEGVAPQSSDEVESELTRHLHMSELRGAVLEHRLRKSEAQGKLSQRLATHDNMQLLQELQVGAQDTRELSRQVEAAQTELRDLHTKYRILEARARGDSTQQPPRSASAGGAADAGEAGASEGSTEGGGGGGDGRGQYGLAFSMAGRVAPSRPVSAYPVNRSWAPGGSTSRPGSAVPTARDATGRPYRNAGGALPPGTFARGSPVRALHELIGAERDRVSELMTQLQHSSEELEKQRAAAAAASNALTSAAVASGLGLGMDGSLEDGGGAAAAGAGSSSRDDAGATGSVTPGQIAQALKRYGTISNNTVGRRPASAAPKNAIAPTAYGTPARRRPTSAAGVGMRAFVNGNLKAWREG